MGSGAGLYDRYVRLEREVERLREENARLRWRLSPEREQLREDRETDDMPLIDEWLRCAGGR